MALYEKRVGKRLDSFDTLIFFFFEMVVIICIENVLWAIWVFSRLAAFIEDQISKGEPAR